MTEFPMHTRLYREGLDLQRFYSKSVAELGDEIYTLLQFTVEVPDADLQYADCVTQLLGCFEGRFLRIFGSLQGLKSELPQAVWEQLNMGVCKLFYLHRVADFDAYAACIHELDDLLRNHGLQTRTANDQ